MAVSDNKIADFAVDNYAALKLKHPQRETCSVFCLQVSHVLANGSGARLEGISPQVLKDLIAKLKGQTGLNFLRVFTNLVNMFLGGKSTFRTSAVLLWWKLIALKKA